MLAERTALVYNETRWHGPTIVEVLDAVDPIKTAHRVNGIVHNIAEFVAHFMTCRYFTVQMFQGNVKFKIEIDGVDDWQTVEEALSQENWTQLRTELEVCQ